MPGDIMPASRPIEMELTPREIRDYLRIISKSVFAVTGECLKRFEEAFFKDVRRNRKARTIVDGWLDMMDLTNDDDIKKMRRTLFKIVSKKETGQILIGGKLVYWCWNDKQEKE